MHFAKDAWCNINAYEPRLRQRNYHCPLKMPSLTGLPTGSLILVTGANGFIASHVINTLLQLEYRVRGTVRTAKPWLDAFFENKFGRGVFESFVLPDFENPEMLDNCMDGIAGVVHTVCL